MLSIVEQMEIREKLNVICIYTGYSGKEFQEMRFVNSNVVSLSPISVYKV